MAKKTIQRSIEERYTLRLTTTEVLAMLRETGYVPDSVSGAKVEFEASTETGAVVTWRIATSSTEEQ